MPRQPSPRRRASTAPPTPRSARHSCACSRVRCRPPPRTSISSSPPCCATRSSTSGPRAMPCAPPMRLSADALNRFGETIGRDLAAPAVIGLSGELGTGKTTLVQAICRGLGAKVRATSPTYALVHHYDAGATPVYHVDCYRLRHSDEARDLGFDDMMREQAIILIEWPERAGGWAPPLDRHFQLSYNDDPTHRVVEE